MDAQVEKTPHQADTPIEDESQGRPFGTSHWIGLLGGAAVFTIMLLVNAPDGLSQAGWHAAAVALLMATWWVTEVIPIAATSLLPLVLFPVLDIRDISDTAAPYAHPMIFLFLGGFIIATAMQRWGLHRRIALNIIRAIGVKPGSIIAGFMVSAAFMSMWVSNTAATLMMLPIGLSVIALAKEKGADGSADRYHNFALVLMLGIAYASNIGGLATIIGTPTNALMIGFAAETYGVEISFVEWMLVGLPVVLIGIPIAHLTLTRLVYPLGIDALPGGREFVASELKGLGRMSRPEVMVAGVFVLVAILWIARPLLETVVPGLSDAGIAIFGALLLFVLPVNVKDGVFLMNWKSAESLPWGVLILFGGGLTLAGAIQDTGLAVWIGEYFDVVGNWPILLVLVIVTGAIITLTELTSNSATAASFLPIMGALALGIGENPLLFLVPIAIGASCAFMLPVATPPNAVVYGSGVMSIPEMAKAGFVLNIIFTLLIALLTYTLIALVLGIDIGVVPDWAM